MNNILDRKTGKLTILLADPHTEEATNHIKEIVNDLANKNIPTLIYEFNSEEYWKKLKSDEDKLKTSNLYLGKTPYIEDVCYASREHQKLYNTKYLLIDGLEVMQTIQIYELGKSDIISLIVKQLKKLAQELNIAIIATAPTSPKTNTDELENNKSKVLSYFCNPETAIEFIDNVYLLSDIQ